MNRVREGRTGQQDCSAALGLQPATLFGEGRSPWAHSPRPANPPFPPGPRLSSLTFLPNLAEPVFLWYKMKLITSPEPSPPAAPSPTSPFLGPPSVGRGGGEHGLWEARVTRHSGSWGSGGVPRGHTLLMKISLVLCFVIQRIML